MSGCTKKYIKIPDTDCSRSAKSVSGILDIFKVLLCKNLSYAVSNSLILTVSKEQLLELSSAESTLNELSVEILENVADVGL